MARTQTFLNGEVGLNIRNKLNSLAEWTGSYSYNTYDVTHFNGSIYASLVDSNLGNTPSTSAQWKNLTLSASYATSASLASSASYVPNLYPQIVQVSASWASSSLNASTASYALVAEIALNASTPVSVSYASASLNAETASHVLGNVVFGPVQDSVNAVTASYALTIPSSPTLEQAYGSTLTFVNPNDGGTSGTTPTGILEFKCNEFTGSGNLRAVVRITATKDDTVPDGGVGGRFAIGLETPSGGIYDRMVMNRVGQTIFTGSVIAQGESDYGYSGFTGSLNGQATSAVNAVSASYADYAPTVGLTATRSFTDSASLQDNVVHILNGLIIEWQQNAF